MRTFAKRVAFSICLALLFAAPARAEFTCELSFPHAPSTALANFPVLVRISETAPDGFLYTDCPTTNCLWFTDANDDTLPFDVDTWNTSGTSLVWVSVPSLSSTATITMHWDAGGAASSVASSLVWTRANYNAVWHFNGDATESANGLVPNLVKNNPTYAVNADGGIGKVLWLNGTQTISYANDAKWTTLGATDSLTITLLAHPNSGLATHSRMVCCQTSWDVKNGYTFAVHNPANKIVLGSSDSSELYLANNEWSGWPANDWVHFAAIYENTTGKIFLDGVSKKTGTIKKLYTPEQALCLGANGDGNQRYWDGGLDEIRIRAAASSAEWVAEEYSTITNTAYCSFGPIAEGTETLRVVGLELSNVTTSSVVVAGTVTKLGEGATSASVWAVYTDGTTTGSVSLGSVSTVPQRLQVRLDNLAPNTAYTVYLTATNNASPSAGSYNTVTAPFKTLRVISGVGFLCELTFPHAPATPLANFPALVRISESGINGFHYADCFDASCLWFEDDNGDVLPFEVDTWNDEGESLVWVSVPSLSSSSTILMRWADSGAEVSPDPTNVWSRANYVGVWHMNELLEDTTLNKHYTPDSSANGWKAYKAKETDDYPLPISDKGLATSAPPTGRAMVNQLGGNHSVGGFIVQSSDTSGTTIGPFTISFFEEDSSSTSFNDRAVAFGTGWTYGCITANKSTTYLMQRNGGYGNFTYGDGLADNAWRHIAGVFDATPSQYVGGVPKTLTINSPWQNNKSTATLSNGIGLGTFTGHSETLTGYLDEIRIRNAASTADWVAAEYATVTDGGYVSFGEVQELGGGAAALEIGTPAVSGVTASGATVSARLKSIGDGATSANVCLVVSGFGQTRTFPAADTYLGADLVTIQATNLLCGTEWTAYLTATNNLGISTNSASVVFSTLSDGGSSSGGLIQAVTDDQNLPKKAASGWDFDGDATAKIVIGGPLAMRSSGNAGDVWFAADGTRFQWTDNTGFGYTGYMYMEGGKDYWFGGAIDDQGYVWVDNGAANWNAAYSASQLGNYNNWQAKGPFSISETGWYRVVFSVWNISGGAGAEQANNPSLMPKLRYAAVAPGSSKPAMSDVVWQHALDPGDGSLFLPHAPVRAVSVLSAARDGALLSAKVAVAAAYVNETSELRYVYGAAHGGDDPADWDGGAFLSASLPATAATNDWLVGIGANSRYVRFYTTNGDTINWSQTVSLDWASETTIPDTLVFIGDPAIQDIRADGASFSALLDAPGEAATEAQTWFVVTGGGETFAFPAGTATDRTNLTVTATGLTPATEYTVYCTATNNAATPAGADSVALTFTTCGAETTWDPSSAVFAFDGRVITAKVPVTNVGLGTTTLYLMTGDRWDRENNAIATNVVAGAGKQTIVVDISASTGWGVTVYYSLKLVCVTGGVETVDWPNQNGQVFYNKSYQLKDDSTYTWIGGSAGGWSDTNNWSLTTAGTSAKTNPSGYPVLGSTAVFATEVGDGPITVTIPAAQGTTWYNNSFNWLTTTMNLSGMHEPLVFTSEDKTVAGCRFWPNTLIADQTYNRLVFDDCNVYLNSIQNVGAAAADENGENFTITLTGGTTAQFNSFTANRPGVKVRAEDGATVNAGALSGGTAYPPPVLEIDGGSVSATKVEPDTWSSANGTTIRLLGANSVFTPQYFQPKNATSTNVIEFVIPAGGYSAVPVQQQYSYRFPVTNTAATATMTLKIAADSPGLMSIPVRGIQLLNSPGGIIAANVRFVDAKEKYNGFYFKDADGNKYANAAEIEAAGKTAADIKQIWYKRPNAGSVYYIR